MSKEIDMETQAIFNGDTPQGRAMWVPWLRSLELGMDEWSWAVLQGEVLPHGKVKELMEMDQSKRTAAEQEGIDRVLEEASKGRDARQSKKSIANWKKEMEKDPGAFCMVIRDTERQHLWEHSR